MTPKTGQKFIVAGNNDVYCHFSDEELPKILIVEIEGETIAIEHGDRYGSNLSHESLRKAHSDAKIVVYGHTHKRTIDKEEQPWVINPGAAGKTRTEGGASCLVIQCSNDKEWQINEYCFSE